MEVEVAKVEWIVKTALTNESVSTNYLLELMKKQGVNSFHLLNYIDDDQYWPTYTSESTKSSDPKDEKYVLQFSGPLNKHGNRVKREMAREAVYSRFYTGQKFNEWVV